MIGGAKISSKIGVLRHLLDIADEFIIGGGMANTLLKASGIKVGSSLVEDDKLDEARGFLDAAKRKGTPVDLPSDVVIPNRIQGAPIRGPSTLTKSLMAGLSSISVPIGPQFAAVLEKSGTVVWNGPMGVFEIPAFAEGTRAIASALAASEREQSSAEAIRWPPSTS